MMNLNELHICKECLMLSTRPRLKFDENGVCTACNWAKEKRTVVDWKARENELIALCDKHKATHSFFNCVVPVSGGKDSSTVSHKLKYKYGMTPLCINIDHSPSAVTKLNDVNLNNFIENGFDCLRVYPNPKILRFLDKKGLVDYGQPYFGWMSAMVLAPIKIALLFGIPFIMYGEEGEVEYGGSTELKNTATYGLEHVKRLYLSGIDLDELCSGFDKKDLWWWTPPTEEELERLKPDIAHWSYFENWDSENNYKYAKKYVNLKTSSSKNSGTYSDYAQTDSFLYPLHTYFMYLKFGFGRCSQDVCIDIRGGRLTREEGKKLIEEYDGLYPKEFEEQYLEYYEMTKEEFHNVIDKWANKDLLYKESGEWKKKFNIGEL